MIQFNLKNRLILALGLWLTAAWCGAKVLQDWTSIGPGFAGAFADKDGSTLDLSTAPGPVPGEKALSIKAHIVNWAGLWSALDMDLSGKGALRFMAKSSRPQILEVGLMDRNKVKYTVEIRVRADNWKEFVLPLSLFRKGAYQMTEAPLDQTLDWPQIRTLQFQPQIRGDSTLLVGPVSLQKGKVKAETGVPEEKNTLLVQDFAFLDKTAYGPYTDGKTSTTIQLTLEKDPQEEGAQLAHFQYDLKAKGWAGYWMRAGDVWGGQDWNGAKAFTLKVSASEPLKFQIGFNDTNQNAYVAEIAATRGNGWEKLSIPFSQFKLNPYYQPPGAKKGLPQDLSNVETINIAPETEGRHDFQAKEIVIER